MEAVDLLKQLQEETKQAEESSEESSETEAQRLRKEKIENLKVMVRAEIYDVPSRLVAEKVLLGLG